MRAARPRDPGLVAARRGRIHARRPGPPHRLCSGWSAGQLKIAQEAPPVLFGALTVFGLFMVFVLGEAVSWRHLAAFACIMAAAAFLFVGR